MNDKSSIASNILSLMSKGSLMNYWDDDSSKKATIDNIDILYKTSCSQHEFNTPYQIGSVVDNLDIPLNNIQFDSPRAADINHINGLQDNDIILCGSDGIFDNLFLYEISNVIVDNMMPFIMKKLQVSSSTASASSSASSSSTASSTASSSSPSASSSSVSKINSNENSNENSSNDNKVLIHNSDDDIDETTAIENTILALYRLTLQKQNDRTCSSPWSVALTRENQRLASKQNKINFFNSIDRKVVAEELGGKPDDLSIILSLVKKRIT
jgi:hypothetical protein